VPLSFSFYPFGFVHLTRLQILNRHSTQNMAYQVGISEDKGTRRTMEDAHSFVVDFAGVRGQGFFAVFDGHAGKHAAEWCGSHFHEVYMIHVTHSYNHHSHPVKFLLDCLRAAPYKPVPDILNEAFHSVDERLSRMCEESDGKIHSGCTAVTAFLRVEDPDGKQSFLATPSLRHSRIAESPSTADSLETRSSKNNSSENLGGADPLEGSPMIALKSPEQPTSRIRRALSRLSGSSSISIPRSSSPALLSAQAKGMTVVVPPTTSRRMLYTANAGDARGVLCRGGKGVRLTYDHKGSDKQEAKRITDAGGFVMSGRVNGVLAVTRSLGDSSMKEFVVGSPYTTETELCDEDEFLILACDGVRFLLPPLLVLFLIYKNVVQLWDVVGDQAAIDLIREVDDAQAASQKLLKHALSHHTTDNVTVLVVRFKTMMPHTA
jgi:protein phosphatase PTC1